MAPEVLSGAQVGFYADIWSFGCILYELLKKEQLFKSKNYVK
jgi:serine/threonine protein kinase